MNFWVHAAPGWSEMKCVNLTVIHSGTATPKWPLTKALTCHLWELSFMRIDVHQALSYHMWLDTGRHLSKPLSSATHRRRCRQLFLDGLYVLTPSSLVQAIRVWLPHNRKARISNFAEDSCFRLFDCHLYNPVWSLIHWSRVICHFAWHDGQIFMLDSKSGQRQSSGPHWLQSAHRWISGVSRWPQLCQKDSYTWMWA